MNPHKKETRVLHYLDEAFYRKSSVWRDTDFWVETGGLALVICTINCNVVNSGNIGFRLVDENNEPLAPYRTSNNTRNTAHFTAEPSMLSNENFNTTTFHMVVNCEWVKLQILPNDGSGAHHGAIFINRLTGRTFQSSPPDAAWSHKPISTMTAIPLLPHYQGGANTVFIDLVGRRVCRQIPGSNRKKCKIIPKMSHRDRTTTNTNPGERNPRPSYKKKRKADPFRFLTSTEDWATCSMCSSSLPSPLLCPPRFASETRSREETGEESIYESA